MTARVSAADSGSATVRFRAAANWFDPGARAWKVVRRDLADTLWETGLLLKSGKPLGSALAASLAGRSAALRRYMRDVQTRVDSGDSLSSALAAQSKVAFSGLAELIAAAEHEDGLADNLSEIGEYYAEIRSLENAASGMRHYFIALLCIVALVLMIYLGGVAPQLEAMYSTYGASLPVLTRLVFSVSHFMASGWFIVGVLLVVIVIVDPRGLVSRVGILRSLRTKVSRAVPHSRLTNVFCAYAFSRTAELAAARGLAVAVALNIALDATANSAFHRRLQTTGRALKRGVRISDALVEAGLLPPGAAEAANAGLSQEGGAALLTKLADGYRNRWQRMLLNRSEMHGTWVFYLAAAIVGIIVIALYLPIFGLGRLV